MDLVIARRLADDRTIDLHRHADRERQAAAWKRGAPASHHARRLPVAWLATTIRTAVASR